MSILNQFTVIGQYDEEGQTFAHVVEAGSAQDAMIIAARDVMRCDSDACIIGAIEGEITLYAPCDDTGKSAYACDVAECL